MSGAVKALGGRRLPSQNARILEKLDLLLLTVARDRKVHADGIRYQGLRYVDATLAAYIGELVTLRYDPVTWLKSGYFITIDLFAGLFVRKLQARLFRSGKSCALVVDGGENYVPSSVIGRKIVDELTNIKRASKARPEPVEVTKAEEAGKESLL